MAPVFEYKVKDSQGNNRSGTIESEDSKQVVNQLKDEGYYIISIDKKKPGKNIENFFTFSKRVKLSDLSLFSQQFATMINAGINLVDSLMIMQEQLDHPGLKKVLAHVQEDVETGASLSEAFSKHPKVFPNLYVQMIKAGESGGVLDRVLNELAEHYENQEEINGKIKSALYYPITILIVAVAVIIFLVSVIVPQFISIFAGLGAKLPLPTRILLGTSSFIQNYWWLLTILMIVFILGLYSYGKTNNGQALFDKLLLKIPVLGDMMHKIYLSRFSSTLSILLESGVDLLTSLTIVEDVIGNKEFSRLFTEARGQVREGINFTQPLAESSLIPNMVVQMIKVGEEAGTIESMLRKVSDFYEREVENSIESTISLIEPIMIVILAVIVGFVAVSIVMPMFDMFQNI